MAKRPGSAHAHSDRTLIEPQTGFSKGGNPFDMLIGPSPPSIRTWSIWQFDEDGSNHLLYFPAIVGRSAGVSTDMARTAPKTRLSLVFPD